ncbi:UMP kinase [Thermotoga sp. KOL6]|uniref:UMP kinase n=1 Tax=Thermotoga sp. KOL6 TaxID=126741 RepID=UPI000C76F48F|nr:UMP kinase [Thermotoga sp. KOL6]PLV60255.1 uridylate kinase [Thermotoga sp. KOL6]
MRVMVKISGEALSGEGNKGFDQEKIKYLVSEIEKVVKAGYKIGIVTGAGNLFRGIELKDLSMKRADQIGLLGTIMNAIYLKDRFEKNGLKAKIFSQIVNLPDIEKVNYDSIEAALQDNFILIFAGGTSNPFFTTDTAAVLRAQEMGAEIIVKATKVDGVYDKDPKRFPDAKKIDRLTFTEAMRLGLKVMDAEAFALCRKLKIVVKVINFFEPNTLLRALKGEKVGSTILPD